jgi:hypothetical protein
MPNSILEGQELAFIWFLPFDLPVAWAIVPGALALASTVLQVIRVRKYPHYIQVAALGEELVSWLVS